MDLTQMQQTVMDADDVSSPQETYANPDSTLRNTEQAYEPLNYEEVFPALTKNIPGQEEEVSTPVNQWTQNSDMRIASSVVTQVFRVPYEERAKIDGSSQFGESASSRICADITAKTGAHIEISSAKDQSLTFLVTGKSEAVLKAKRLTLEKFQTLARQIIRVPKEYHRYILGKKWKKLQELESSTGTKIQVPNANDSSTEIVIMGPKDAIEKAVHEIRLIEVEQSKQASEKLEIPKIYHPFINTVTNEKLSALLNEHSIRLNIPPLSIAKNEITISGEKEGVMLCKDLILQIYEEMEKKCQTVSVEVRKSKHKYVIGPRGANITEILQETNVSVEMPPSDSPSDTITLRGPQDKLGQALTKVYEKSNSVDTVTVEAPAWLHKFIIGKGGAAIKQLTMDFPKVHIEFSNKEGKIKLEGPPEEVEATRKVLNEIIQSKQKVLTYDELAVPPQYYKHIIGKNGSNINKIRNDSDVSINILEVNDKNIIRLEGTPQGVTQAKKVLVEFITKMENEIEKEITIDNRFHRSIIGTKGDKIREIREKFNQVQISFPDLGEKSNAVKIRGPKEDVDKCAKHLQNLAKELNETSYHLKVSIGRQHHKFIIGKGGANINKIREETNTKIELPSEGQNSDEIIIIGRKDNCDKAKARIQKIQNELSNVVEFDIMIPGKFHNAIIGAGGRQIQAISEECGGVTIKFPPPEMKSDKVNIRGSKEDAQKAKQKLIELSNEKQLSGYTAEVRAKPQLHRFLIGKKGCNISKIRDKTGARIIFPNDRDSHTEVITIIGKKDAVEKAKAELEATIKELSQTVEVTISVDAKYHRDFVSRRGEVLKQISDEHGGVIISFPRQGDDSDKVTIKGLKDSVDAAIKDLQARVMKLEQRITIEAAISQKFHKSVMGTRGCKIQTIEMDYDVKVKFPERDRNNHNEGEVNGIDGNEDIVYIKGELKNCEQAREALLALVPIEKEVVVPFKYHRFIIGQKGETVKMIMEDHDVNIKVPNAQDKEDKIRIIGVAASVESAEAAILQKVKDLEDEEEDRLKRSFQIKFHVEPEYHPKIIGRKGAVISKIREKYDVNIQFPQRGGPNDDIITISGYEENCIEAKKAILDITGDLESMVKKSIEIDSAIHSRLIGAKGRAIKKVMEDYKVEIRFPRGPEEPNTVVVIGSQDDVDECCDDLMNKADEYMQDLEDEKEMKLKTMPPSSSNDMSSMFSVGNDKDTGFVVSGAPWTQPAPNVNSSEDFPSMGGGATPSVATAWGPKRS